MFLEARAGVITSSKISFSSRQDEVIAETKKFQTALEDKSIQDIRRFKDILGVTNIPRRREAVENLSGWLDTMFGK